MDRAFLLDVLRFVTIMGAGLAAGGLIMVHVVIEPILRTFPLDKSVLLHQVWDGPPHHYMRPSTITAGIAAVVILILGPNLLSPSALLTIGGIAGSFGVFLTSEFGNVPINKKIGHWKIDSIPSNYSQIRARWRLFNGLRTTSAVVALLFYITAALFAHWPLEVGV
jgi:uncharacterized membrane protein